MKIIEKPILPYQEDYFLSPLRDKCDYAKLIAYSLQAFLITYDTKGVDIHVRMKLVIDKMSRLFFYKADKFFSIAFPFNIICEDDNILEIRSYSGIFINNKVVAGLLSILNEVNFKQNMFFGSYQNYEDSIDNSSFDILEEILSSEPAYIRYDCDIKNAKGKLHPAYHLDINYSSAGTFKIGLNEHISESFFEDIQNINTDCRYIY